MFTFWCSCVAPEGLTVTLKNTPHMSYRDDVTAIVGKKKKRKSIRAYTYFNRSRAGRNSVWERILKMFKVCVSLKHY